MPVQRRRRALARAGGRGRRVGGRRRRRRSSTPSSAATARPCARCCAQRADVNRAEADGTTALHWAVQADDLELVTLLLRAGANAKAANRYGVQPLTLAATNGSAAAIDALLEGRRRPEHAGPAAASRC